MAHVHRLIALVLFAVACMSAQATIPKVDAWRYLNGITTSGYVYGGAQAACDAGYPAFNAAIPAGNATKDKGPPVAAAFNGGSQWKCYLSNQAVGGNTWAFTIEKNGQICPANSFVSGSACQCASGYLEFGGNSCMLDNGCMTLLGMTPPNSGACVGGNCQYGYKVSAGEAATAQPYGRFCNAGCTVKGDLDFCGQYSSGVMIAGQGVCQVSKSYYTGDKCTGSGAVSGPSSQGTQGGTTTNPSNTASVEANPIPQRLPEGKCPGQVNGVDVVVNCGSVAARDTSTSNGTTVKPDGTTVNNTTNNTTTTSTVCNGNSCTTTTTVTSGGSGPNGTGTGSTTTTTQETGTKGEMCAKSPSATACKGDDDKPNGFGGSCAGGYKAVSEDAVLNAMAEEQYRRNCQFFDTGSAASQDYATEAAKTGDQTGNLAGNFTQDLSAGADMTDALGGGSCPADQNIPISLGGRTFTLSLALSKACQGLEWLGIALIAATAIACAFIVFRD